MIGCSTFGFITPNFVTFLSLALSIAGQIFIVAFEPVLILVRSPHGIEFCSIIESV